MVSSTVSVSLPFALPVFCCCLSVVYARSAELVAGVGNDDLRLNDAALHAEWVHFKAKHSKTYATAEEEAKRVAIFNGHRERIAKHNALHEAGDVSYTLGLNEFCDLTFAEFKARFTGYVAKTSKAGKPMTNCDVEYKPAEKFTPPNTLDWRKKNMVTPVKNQARCGSCWAFSSTGVMESMHAMATGKLVNLSEQNIMDCTYGETYYNYGCEGGNPFEKAVAEKGPMSACITVDSEKFMTYKSGVYDEPACSGDPNALNHCVLVVGYGKEKGKKYWLVKNSWSEKWGEKGYIKMSRDKKNQCGIASDAMYPII